MKLLIISNPASPGTDYYRTVGPFTRLAKDHPDELDVTVISPDVVVWFDMYQADAVLFQRPNGNKILGFVQEAKKMGKKILFDMDDLLHHLPDSNPAQGHFEQVKETITEALKYCDLLFVSTPPLFNYYANYIDQEKIVLARNAWTPEDHPLQPVEKQHDPARMLWRGSVTHMADLHTVKPVLRLTLKDDAFAVVFVGLEKWLMFDLPEGKAQHVKWQTLFNYFKLMRESQPDYGFFPLVKDEFNLCKSNIFAIECLWAGALPIVPAGFPEWDMIPGLLRYSSNQEFIDITAKIKAGKIDRERLIEKGRAFLAENMHICIQNEPRREALKRL